jgi:C1A family cysteine protease
MYQNTGGALNTDYPYTGVQGSCDNSKVRNPKKLAGTNSGYIGKDENTFVNWNAGVVLSVIISVNQNFMSYRSGIFNDPTCVSARTGLHAVTLNGYSTPEKYWILRNSWGATWGEAGYFRFGKGTYGVCGLYDMGLYIN